MLFFLFFYFIIIRAWRWLLCLWVTLCIGVGVTVMHFFESLGWMDSLYLSVMSVTTVGLVHIRRAEIGTREKGDILLFISTARAENLIWSSQCLEIYMNFFFDWKFTRIKILSFCYRRTVILTRWKYRMTYDSELVNYFFSLFVLKKFSRKFLEIFFWQSFSEKFWIIILENYLRGNYLNQIYFIILSNEYRRILKINN